MSEQQGEASPVQPSAPRVPPPPVPPPPADFTPKAEQLQEFAGLIVQGKKRYQQVVAGPRPLAPEEAERRRAAFDRYYRVDRPEAGYEAGAQTITVKPEVVAEVKAAATAGAPAVATALAAAVYINAAAPEIGEIRAYHNVNPVRQKDGPQLPPWVLSSSEIQYQQYRLACRGGIAPLRAIQRRNVGSGTGNTAMTCTRALVDDQELFETDLTPDDPSGPKTEDQGELRAERHAAFPELTPAVT